MVKRKKRRSNQVIPEVVELTTMDGLTSIEDRFVDEYLIDLNPIEAAQRAGIDATPYYWSGKWLHDSRIIAVIQKRRNKIGKKYEVSRERCIENLSKLANYNLQDFQDGNGKVLPLQQIDRDAAFALTRVKKKEFTIGTGEDAGAGEEWDYWGADKKGANQEILKILGAYEKHNKLSLELTLGGIFKNLPPEIAEAFRSKLIEAVSQKKMLEAG